VAAAVVRVSVEFLERVQVVAQGSPQGYLRYPAWVRCFPLAPVAFPLTFFLEVAAVEMAGVGAEAPFSLAHRRKKLLRRHLNTAVHGNK